MILLWQNNPKTNFSVWNITFYIFQQTATYLKLSPSWAHQQTVFWKFKISLITNKQYKINICTRFTIYIYRQLCRISHSDSRVNFREFNFFSKLNWWKFLMSNQSRQASVRIQLYIIGPLRHTFSMTSWIMGWKSEFYTLLMACPSKEASGK